MIERWTIGIGVGLISWGLIILIAERMENWRIWSVFFPHLSFHYRWCNPKLTVAISWYRTHWPSIDFTYDRKVADPWHSLHFGFTLHWPFLFYWSGTGYGNPAAMWPKKHEDDYVAKGYIQPKDTQYHNFAVACGTAATTLEANTNAYHAQKKAEYKEAADKAAIERDKTKELAAEKAIEAVIRL